MNDKTKRIFLGIYNLILSVGAIGVGRLMILSNYGIFIEFPKEWLTKVPFTSWVIPGIVVIIIFGLGNMIASILCFCCDSYAYLVVSTGMGIALLFSVISMGLILGEWYLANIELIVIGLVQLILCSIRISSRIANKKLS
jgi:hypothetical protein